MKKSWEQIKLGDVLTPVSRAESVDPSKTYNILGAHWYAKGLYTKNILTGAGIQAPKVYRVQAGDFVYNRLFAWKGSFALATAENDGCYVSNEFPCFSVNSDRLDGKYLWLYFSRHSAWDEALGLSTGGTPTSRNRLKEGQFLSLMIPLPPLPEQRRIVARIEELSAKIEEARIVRSKTSEEVEDLIASQEMQMWPHKALKDAPTLESVTTYLARGRQSTQGPSDHFLIKTQHVQMGRYIPSDMTLAPWIANRVRNDALVRIGDVLIACSAAGCLGRVAFFEDHRGRIISTDTHVAIARANEERLLPEYLLGVAV